MKEPTIEQSVERLLVTEDPGAAGAIAEMDLVRRVISFANLGRPEGLPGIRALEVNGQTFILMEGIPEQQAQLRKDLAAIVRADLSGPAVARLLKQARHVIVRSYEIQRGELEPRERHFVGDSLATLLADVLLRVRSNEKLRKDLRQCQLKGCGRFFLAMRLD